MELIKYCPTCRSELNPYSLKDAYLQGLSCLNEHYFFKTCQDVLSTESIKASKMSSPASGNEKDIDVIEYWLTDNKARATLNNQIAVILRRIYEILKDNRHIPYNDKVFVFCPLCRMPLEMFDQPDIWVRGKRCNNSHEFYERGGTVNFSFQGKRENLSEEMSDKTLLFLIDGWLKSNRLLEEQLHGEVKKILTKFKENVKKDEINT